LFINIALVDNYRDNSLILSTLLDIALIIQLGLFTKVKLFLFIHFYNF